jgi:hypothetical protein
MRIAIVGGGPTGLIAAEILSAAGEHVTVYERMPSVGRKLLMAGRGGLNLTHSEPAPAFIARYGEARPHLAAMLEAFDAQRLIAWVEGLGEPTFVGSSGRVFPKAMKASPFLRKWLARLGAQHVVIEPNTYWLGWDEAGRLRFERHGAIETVDADVTLLALGGASWPRLGSNGAWRNLLAQRGVALSPFKPANVGFNVAWSDHFRTRFAGAPLKNIALRFGQHRAEGEAIITSYGLEGGAIYALAAPMRDALEQTRPVTLNIDLRPRLSEADIAGKLANPKHSDTLSSRLRKVIGLAPVGVNLLREACGNAPPTEAQALARLIKSAPIALTHPRGLDRAISSAGGVAWTGVDQTLQLCAIPGTYAAGEMLDWEAPTGGYLLQACFATGAWAARAILRR